MDVLALLKSKTVWASVAIIATAGAGYASGDMTASQAVHGGLVGLMGIFLRMGVASNSCQSGGK